MLNFELNEIILNSNDKTIQQLRNEISFGKHDIQNII